VPYGFSTHPPAAAVSTTTGQHIDCVTQDEFSNCYHFTTNASASTTPGPDLSSAYAHAQHRDTDLAHIPNKLNPSPSPDLQAHTTSPPPSDPPAANHTRNTHDASSSLLRGSRLHSTGVESVTARAQALLVAHDAHRAAILQDDFDSLNVASNSRFEHRSRTHHHCAQGGRSGSRKQVHKAVPLSWDLHDDNAPTATPPNMAPERLCTCDPLLCYQPGFPDGTSASAVAHLVGCMQLT
jgi:hypothetical protein